MSTKNTQLSCDGKHPTTYEKGWPIINQLQIGHMMGYTPSLHNRRLSITTRALAKTR